MGRKKLVRKAEPSSKRGIAWPRWTGFRGKTVWEWMQLLIVPLVLTVLGLFLTTAQQDVRQQAIENQRAEAERELAAQQAQDEALQAYLDVMKELLLEQDLRASRPGSSARAVANVQTLIILERIDPSRKRAVLRLLTDSHLIDADAPLIETSTLALQAANAKGMDLSDTDLSRASLHYANLTRADLSDANLSETLLVRAELSGANLNGANLNGANLSDASLDGATGITNEELEQQASSLNLATMPNGQKYEDWLKSKDRGEDGENE